MNPSGSPATKLLEALASAWNTLNLYPNPNGKPPWERSLAALAELSDQSITIDVEPDGFSQNAVQLQIRNQAVGKLARQLFTHNVASLALVRAPASGELASFFQLLASMPNEGEEFGNHLDLAGVRAFRTRTRPELTEHRRSSERVIGGEIGRSEEVNDVIRQGAVPRRFARKLMKESGEDPARLAEVFCAQFEYLFRLVEAEDWSGRDKIVQTFAETFAFLPIKFQLATISWALERRHERHFQLFLDQFAAYELATLAPGLESGVFQLLLDYARVAATENDGQPDLESLLQLGPDLEGAQQAVVGRIGERVAGIKDFTLADLKPFEALRQEVAEISLGLENGVEVMRGLLQVEQRSHRVQRLLRIWASRVSDAVQRGRFEDALAWVEGLSTEVFQVARRNPELGVGYHLVATPELLRLLVDDLDSSPSSPRRRLLAAIGRHAVAPIVELLGTEEDSTRRRALIDLMVDLAKLEIEAMIPHTRDRRWYVVRNLVVVLGRAGRKEAIPTLIGLTKHADHRVRSETLRALVTLAGREAAPQVWIAVSDANDRVQLTAVGLLPVVHRGNDYTTRIPELLNESALATETKLKLIELLATDHSPFAQHALQELAGRRAGLSGGVRALRDAARSALESRSSRAAS